MKITPRSQILTIFAVVTFAASLAAAGSLSAQPVAPAVSDDGFSEVKGDLSGFQKATGSGLLPTLIGNGSLTTLFAQNNGFRGNSFDLEGLAPCLEIVGWDFNFTNAAGVNGDVSIYWRTGTANGFEGNGGAGWTLLGTGLVTTAGNNLPTHLDVGGLVIHAGDLVGIYYYVDDYPNPRTGYTNGSNLYSNADLSLQTLAGIGASAPFTGDGIFSSRQVNVTVHYDTASPACRGGKALICHVPRNNPDNAHVIEVGEAAVPAHMAHGDCKASGGAQTGDPCGC